LRAELSEADYHLANALELVPRAVEIEAIGEFLGDCIKATARDAHYAAIEISPHRAALQAEDELPLGKAST
jgi:hypothetical protein